MNQLYLLILLSFSFAQTQHTSNIYQSNSIFGNILQKIKFANNRFVFLTDNNNIFEVDSKDYNENDYHFKFNESNITLIKEHDKPSPLTIPLHYSNFFRNNFFLIVDKSFSDSNEVNDIKIDSEYVRFLTYSSVIPFKFGSKLKLIQIDIGNSAEIGEIDFTSLLEVKKKSKLTLSTFSDQTDRLLNHKKNHVIFDKVFLSDNSNLVSDSEHFSFPQISIEKNGFAKLEGVKSNGDVYIEGARSSVSIVSNPAGNRPSNFGESRINVKISDDLYALQNSPSNWPLLNFDTSSIKNSIKSIKVSFENYNSSLFHSKEEEPVRLLTLLAVENQDDDFQCKKFADVVSFEPKNDDETVKFSALCKNGKVEVHCRLSSGEEDESESPTTSSDESGGDDGGGNDEGKKKKRMIALICAFGSAAIILIVAVCVSLYLKKHYKEGDSDKAQILTQLNQDGTPDTTI
ncbi:hypothetical protein M9Y10_003513 [Tritrichomonas musculus]|uniref:Uncharacterized protein n=1 Tax=Tritrichomonas musculus TaxID=1915356 RepID=A0ABR2JQZ3_9EUKA